HHVLGCVQTEGCCTKTTRGAARCRTATSRISRLALRVVAGAVERRSNRLASILNHNQSVLICYHLQRGQVAWVSVQIDGQDSFGTRCNRLLDELRVKIECFRIDVYKNRPCTHKENTVG